eukprot:566333-Prorocentrum_lima.AAC.1
MHPYIETYSCRATKWAYRVAKARAAQTRHTLFGIDIPAALRFVRFDFPRPDVLMLQTLPCVRGY